MVAMMVATEVMFEIRPVFRVPDFSSRMFACTVLPVLNPWYVVYEILCCCRFGPRAQIRRNRRFLCLCLLSFRLEERDPRP